MKLFGAFLLSIGVGMFFLGLMLAQLYVSGMHVFAGGVTVGLFGVLLFNHKT